MAKPVSTPAWVALVVALIASLGAVVAALVSGLVVVSPSSRILSPSPGETVGRTPRISGELGGIADTLHVWLAIRLDDRMWLKEPEIPIGSRKWTSQIALGVSGRAFALRLLAVSPAGQEFIEEWLERGRRTAEYPGLTHIPGAVLLDEVDGLVPSDTVEPGRVRDRDR